MLRQGRKMLCQNYNETKNSGAILLRDHCRLVDSLLHQAWQETVTSSSIALLAVGGYGRRQLFPGSDIDLLVLIPAKEKNTDAVDSATKLQIERLIRFFWDMGLEVSHSVRTLAECVEESVKDITVQTNLLEARLLVGNCQLFSELESVIRDTTNPNTFLTAKLFEQQCRHNRYHGATNNLEPNLKESPGSLRDLHNILWVSHVAGTGKSWLDLTKGKFITLQEARLANRCQTFLQDLRIRLHYLTGRQEDRLLFDYQAQLAKELGIIDKSPRYASEILMQRYYRVARSVTQINNILLLALQVKICSDIDTTLIPINKRFQKYGQFLEICTESIFQEDPSAIFESSLLLQQHAELKARSAVTLRALWHATKFINLKFRNNPHNQSLFMQILRQPHRVTQELRFMNRYGILGRYLTSFGRIVGQMQHDLFHVYTVDEHILMVVRNLRRFMIPKFSQEHPLCSGLMAKFDRPEILYLAGLFHDIAKGRSGDHSLLGKKHAKQFCKQHEIFQEDAELLVWLVENHLLMSITAQKQDLSDRDVISVFAKRVKDDRHLVALYLLTVADILGTSPKIWNTWKDKLLENLFWMTRQYLNDKSDYINSALESRKIKVLELLALNNTSTEVYERFWSEFDAAYLLKHDPQEIAWHAHQLIGHLDSSVPVVKARAVPNGGGIQVMVYTPDQKNLFAYICGFFEGINYSIVEAKIYTTNRGYAIDSFLVLNPFKAVEQYHNVISIVEHELAYQLEQKMPLVPPPQGRLNRHLKYFPITPTVDIEPDRKSSYYRLSIVAGDQIGLLSSIAQVLVHFGVNVHSAKINTLGARAEDIFWVTGKVLSEQKKLLHLKTEMLAILEIPSNTTLMQSVKYLN